MQELVRTSTAVPVISSSHPPPTTSSSIFQQSFYGSESTVTSNASSDADKGLLTSADEKKSSCSDEEEGVRGGGHLGITGQSDSDSDDGSDGGSVNLKDEHGRDVSPIAEVAAVVANTDDPSIPCLTFRFWVMGLFSIFSLSFVNQVSVHFFRDAPMVVSGLVIQLLSYPIGKFMARVIPTTDYSIFGKKLTLNPGPFNVKEHVLITIMANCGAGTAYAVDIIVIQRVFYKQDFGFFANLLLILTTQLVGYGMAGILRRYLVYPAAMIWPSNLATVALFNTLHRREELTPGQWTRQKFFAACAIGSFLYYWIPAYIFPAITTLTLLCYIQPSNVVLSQLTGSQGLGMGVLSLDWNTITAFLGSPLITPWWAQVNIMLGFILFAWIMVPTAYYLDIWNAKTYPILSSKLFTTEGYYYDTLSILTPAKTLDEPMYKAYGPLRITTFFAISYGIGFAGLTAILTHTFLYHRKQIWAQWKEARGASQDVHYKLMQAYKEVPEWWYLTLFCITVMLSIITCEVWDYGLPWWCVLLAVGISALFSLPIGLIQAVTNQQPGLNILTEFIIGYILPGRPIANVTFKTYGYISMSHAMSFLGDLKLGQYMKIPPRTMFMTQLIGTFIAGFVNLITANWLLSTRPNICTPEGGHFTCLSANVFYSASVIWGVIAPERMFGSTSIYHPLMYFFLAGLFIPVPFYLVSRRYPGTILDQIHIPVLLTSTGMMPPARPFQYANWLVIGFCFQYCVKRYYNNWYQRFNYVLSAALDSGVAVSALIIFFTLQIHEINFPSWWGTNMNHCPLDKANFYGQVPSNKPIPVVPVLQNNNP
ncbi:MAG: OPT family small oligopeptide transporter [Linnemannia gamsii]|nr:MAG: OPT family small oligopeptide transporter [Linnemannia gamsii]